MARTPVTPPRRFFVTPGRIHEEVVRLNAEETHHLARVLRLGVGARVEVCDGQGGIFEAVVLNLEGAQAALRVVRPLAPMGESPLSLTLAIGLAKGDVLDAVVRQATEMGVTRLIPMLTDRSEKSSPERAARRAQRWQRHMQEGLKTCQRSFLPQMEAPQDFAEVLDGPEEVKLFCWEEERGGGLEAVLARSRPAGVRVLIGPEGGFSEREAAQARAAGYQVVSLGPRRLRVETAALAVLALLQYAWGDLA
jgi:16S rRNA (uracil1498-N3)-methyltransferase